MMHVDRNEFGQGFRRPSILEDHHGQTNLHRIKNEDNFSQVHSQMSELRCEFKEQIDGVKVNIKEIEKSLEHVWAVIEDVQQEAKTNKD